MGVLPEDVNVRAWAPHAEPGDIVLNGTCVREDDERIVRDVMRRTRRKPP